MREVLNLLKSDLVKSSLNKMCNMCAKANTIPTKITITHQTFLNI
jgi:hypothetical protein